MRFFIKEFEDVAIVPPKIRKKNKGGGGDMYNRVYAYYGYLYFPVKFLRLLNNAHEYSGSKFKKILNDIGLINKTAKISDQSYHSDIKNNKDKWVLEGYVASIGQYDDDINKDYKKFLISKLSAFNDENTIKNNDLYDIFNDNGIHLDAGYYELTDPDHKLNILNRYF